MFERKKSTGLQGKELLHHHQCHSFVDRSDLCTGGAPPLSCLLAYFWSICTTSAFSFFSFFFFSPPPWDAELGRYMQLWLFPASYYQYATAPCLFHHSLIARLLLQCRDFLPPLVFRHWTMVWKTPPPPSTSSEKLISRTLDRQREY